MEAILALLFFGAIHCIPAIVAHKREHKQETAILMLNLLLG
jgi:hypothetical protein